MEYTRYTAAIEERTLESSVEALKLRFVPSSEVGRSFVWIRLLSFQSLRFSMIRYLFVYGSGRSQKHIWLGTQSIFEAGSRITDRALKSFPDDHRVLRSMVVNVDERRNSLLWEEYIRG